MKSSLGLRFSAKLLFQYRVGGSKRSKFRICEERIITLRSKSAIGAIREAKKIAKNSQACYVNDDGNKIFVEFVGLLDFMEIGIESDENEVWYEIKTILRPMERKNKIIPPDEKLLTRKINKAGGN